MRVLLLMRGAMGSGKSTWIQEQGLKPYTLCADDIRLLCQSPVLDINGTQKISQKNEKIDLGKDLVHIGKLDLPGSFCLFEKALQLSVLVDGFSLCSLFFHVTCSLPFVHLIERDQLFR